MPCLKHSCMSVCDMIRPFSHLLLFSTLIHIQAQRKIFMFTSNDDKHTCLPEDFAKGNNPQFKIL